MHAKLLVIDDDAAWCEFLKLALTKSGFEVEFAYDAVSGLRKAYAQAPDLVVLDIMLPDMDGWEACRRFRELCGVPILMLTALDSEKHLIQGLDLGADAYLVKPATPEVLVAHIWALLRRTYASQGKISSWKPVFSYDGLVIDFNKHHVSMDGDPVSLSPIEFRLLSLLAQHQGRLLPHNYLLREVWGPEYADQLDILRVYISSLRHKIEKDPSEPSLIYNERGLGYRFA